MMTQVQHVGNLQIIKLIITKLIIIILTIITEHAEHPRPQVAAQCSATHFLPKQLVTDQHLATSPPMKTDITVSI